jgi:hypothetical protein
MVNRLAALTIADEDEEAPARRVLAQTLRRIERNDDNYDLRYFLVIEAVYYAQQCGYAAGFRIDPGEPEWPVAYIELPTGQVSWHLPRHPIGWDGHETPEKYRRCREFTAQQRGA